MWWGGCAGQRKRERGAGFQARTGRMRRCKAASPGHPSLHGLLTTTPKPEEGPPLPELRAPPRRPSHAGLCAGAEGLGPQPEVGLKANFPTPRGRSEHTGRLPGRQRRLFEDRGEEPSPSSSPLFRPESPERAGTVHNPAGTPPPDGHLLVQAPQQGRREALSSGARRHWRGPPERAVPTARGHPVPAPGGIHPHNTY